jgi:hypothetical protein
MKKIETPNQPNLFLPDAKKSWLESAKDIDVYQHINSNSFNEFNDLIYQQILETSGIKNNTRTKQLLNKILLNLWSGYICYYPLMYSRNRSHYRLPARYGNRYYKYRRVINIMGALKKLEYINEKIGYFNKEDGIGRKTRAYASNKLIDIFDTHLDIGTKISYYQQPDEIIHLKDKDKELIDYRENTFTQNIRENLTEYNNFIGKQNIKIDIPCSYPIQTDFIKDIKCNLNKGIIDIESMEIDLQENYDRHIETDIPELNIKEIQIEYNKNSILNYKDKKGFIQSPYLHNYYNNKKQINSNIQTIINVITKNVFLDDLSFIDKHDNKQKITLNELGITKLVIENKFSFLYRVFNNCSFDFGGRFYGAFHLGIPKDLRLFTHINENPIIELDYSALHIRMLYHKEKIRYSDDPYEILCNSHDERKMYKLVQLISINAKNKEKAIQAMRDQFRKNNINHKLTNEALYSLLEKFKTAHKPIEKYLTSGVGIELQNTDSHITDNILNSFVKDGIPILPVHDSFIVEAGCEGLLWKRMAEEYEKVMGFEPVIEKK